MSRRSTGQTTCLQSEAPGGGGGSSRRPRAVCGGLRQSAWTLRRRRPAAQVAKGVHDPVPAESSVCDLEAARKKKAEGSRCFTSGDLAGAISNFSDALALLVNGGGQAVDLRRELWEQRAFCLFEKQEWLGALFSLERAKEGGQQSVKSLFLEGYALLEVGLLDTAGKAFGAMEKMVAGSEEAQHASHEVSAIRARVQALEKGEKEVLAQELGKLRQALPKEEADQWSRAVDIKCQSVAGRQECIDNGFLERGWLREPPPVYTLRAIHRALLFQVKKLLQNMHLPYQISCAHPSSLSHKGSMDLPDEKHWRELHTHRFVVVDGVLNASQVLALRHECELIDRAGLMRSDPDDLCNPLSRSLDIQFASAEPRLPIESPHLREALRCVRGLAQLCEQKLQMQLRVPQTMMLSCYGPGAYYRRHMDSYDGKDIPRKVTILLYPNPEWNPEEGGQLRAWPPGGKVVDCPPLGGRLVIFLAQEVPHEVLESRKDRYCLTLWLWDVKKDDMGR